MNQLNLIRILLVEDDEIDFFIFENYIREIGDKRLVVEWCDDCTKALYKMVDGAYDLYFVDYRLGERTALNLLEEMGKLGLQQPVILLTGKGNKLVDIQAMERGATDYLIKAELDAEKLERCIRYSLDRSKALTVIRESENKYRSLFEQSSDAIFIADSSLFLREVNAASCILFEADVEVITTHNLYHFLNDGNAGRVLYKSLENNYAVNNMEIVIKTEQLRTKICSLTISGIEYENESMFHCILRDITELKKAENVNIQMEKMDTTEKLIRMLGHEIRNPLSNIDLAVESLIYQANEDDKTLLNIIYRNSNRINHLISELIDATRYNDFYFELASLQEIVDETLSSAQDRIIMQKVKVNKMYSNYTCIVWADKKKLKIAISNLVINAIEAMKKNEGELSIEISGNEEHVFLNIKDNGHGIPKEYLTRIFEPFTSFKKNGLGLGLSSSFNILKLHKAEVHVESELESGTVFNINFLKR